jgi:hypothetical protein
MEKPKFINSKRQIYTQLGITNTTLSIQDKITETVYELPVNIIKHIFTITSKLSIYTTNPQAPNNSLSFLHW